jgi:thiol-disulfide isomerase/thioredoxin
MSGMCRRIALAALLAFIAAAAQDIVREVRAAIAQNNFEAGETLIRGYQSAQGVTPEMIEAVSWLGRGALAAKQFDRADGYAMEARKLAQAQLSRRKLDAEPHLPLALGASIEVQAFVMAGRGEGGDAVAFLRRELESWRDTSIVTRIQKNIHLLSLEGKPAPELEVKKWLGPKPAPIAQLRGKPVVLFFWAHWCGDCKRLIPDMARLFAEYRSKGLVLIGPTQHYGYVAGGAEAAPEQETEYMESIRRQFYAPLVDMPAPVSEANFKNYGSSSSPTLVFIDRKGIVRLYHPGSMTYPELVAGVNAILGD